MDLSLTSGFWQSIVDVAASPKAKGGWREEEE